MREVARERFDSTEALCRYVETAEPNAYWENEFRSSMERAYAGDTFYGTESMEEAIGFARTGWDEPVSSMKELTRNKALKSMERVGLKPSRPVNSCVGGSPNVARAVIGLPRDMRSVSFNKRKLPGITLVYEAGVLANRKSSEVRERGTRFLALAYVLEASGTPVKLVCSSSCKSTDTGRIYSCEVVVKDFGKAFNIEKAAFFLANSSFQRRLVFAWRETSDLVTEYLDGYGRSVNTYPRIMMEFKEDAKSRNERWYSLEDFGSDADIVSAYEEIKSRGKGH